VSMVVPKDWAKDGFELESHQIGFRKISPKASPPLAVGQI
jgi:hypothetical protein